MSLEDCCLYDNIRDLLIACVLFCLVASSVGNPIENVQHGQSTDFEITFTAHRLQQYKLNENWVGSKNARFSYDAVSIKDTVVRRCLVVRWNDLVKKGLSEVVEGNVGAVLVLLPKGLKTPTARKAELKTLEEQFAEFETEQAVYFAETTPELETLAESSKTVKAPSAFQQILNLFTENSFQISTVTAGNTDKVTAKHHNIVGRLFANDRNAPTVVVVAHYDSRSFVPGYSNGYDSNGSGVLSLFSVMQKLSQVYKQDSVKAKINIVFVLSALGNYNYIGSKQMVDDIAEANSQNTQRTLLVISLESLLGGENLYAHVSRDPQEKTAPFNFISRLNTLASKKAQPIVVVKQEQINANKYDWEHEVYYSNRISALTLSHFASPNDPARTSLANDVNEKNVEALLSQFNDRTHLIAEALLSYTFNIDLSWCTDSFKQTEECHLIDKDHLNLPVIQALVQSPRPAAALPANLVPDLLKATKVWCKSAELREVKPQDLELYTQLHSELVAQIVKPALFELLLAFIIGVYVFGVYHFSLNAHNFLHSAISIATKPKSQ